MDRELIAKKLIEIRGERTRKQMSNLLGVEVSAISNYENAIRIPSDSIKIKYAAIANESIDEIFF